jgi:hypothetical protein
MKELKNFNLKINNDFCNILIKRRCLRRDAKAVEVKCFSCSNIH